MGEIKQQAVVKLYFATREDADSWANEARTEGLSAAVGRPAVGESWCVEVTGEPDVVLAFGQLLRSRLSA